MKAMSTLSFASNIPTPTISLPRIRRHRSRPMPDMSGPRYVASPSVEAGSRSSWTGGRRRVRRAAGLRPRSRHLPASSPSAPHTGVLGPSWAIPVIRYHHSGETSPRAHASPAPQTRSRYTYTCVVLARVGVMKAMSTLSFASNIPTPTISLPRIRRHRSRPMPDMSGPRYVASPSVEACSCLS